MVEWSSASGIVQGDVVPRYLRRSSNPGEVRTKNSQKQVYRINIIGLMCRRISAIEETIRIHSKNVKTSMSKYVIASFTILIPKIEKVDDFN